MEPTVRLRPEAGRSPGVQITRAPDGTAVAVTLNWPTFLALATPDMLASLSDDDMAGISAARAAAGPEGCETVPMDVAERILLGDHPIRAWREHRGLTQIELAERVDTNKVYLSQIETGKRPAGRKILARLATALNVPMADLMDTRAD